MENKLFRNCVKGEPLLSCDIGRGFPASEWPVPRHYVCSKFACHPFFPKYVSFIKVLNSKLVKNYFLRGLSSEFRQFIRKILFEF